MRLDVAYAAAAAGVYLVMELVLLEGVFLCLRLEHVHLAALAVCGLARWRAEVARAAAADVHVLHRLVRLPLVFHSAVRSPFQLAHALIHLSAITHISRAATAGGNYLAAALSLRRVGGLGLLAPGDVWQYGHISTDTKVQ